MLDERTRAFITESEIPVGVFIDRDTEETEEWVIPVFSVSDVFLFFYVRRIARAGFAKIKLVDYNGIISSNAEILEEISGMRKTSDGSIDLVQKKDFSLAALNENSLLMLSFEGWKVMEREADIDENLRSSVLLMRP